MLDVLSPDLVEGFIGMPVPVQDGTLLKQFLDLLARAWKLDGVPRTTGATQHLLTGGDELSPVAGTVRYPAVMVEVGGDSFPVPRRNPRFREGCFHTLARVLICGLRHAVPFEIG